MTFLLDVSHYQGGINWAQVKADGCVGAYVKVTDGVTGVDAMWQANHAGARGAGIPVGPYHFAEGGNVSAEAAHFASVWSAGWDLHPVLDYEIAGVNPGWLSAFRTYFRQDTGYQPFRVYASEGNLVGALNPANWIDPDTTIWAARYAGSLGWTHPQLVLWQNTSSASVPGILGNVDEDQFQNGWTPTADNPAPPTPVWRDTMRCVLSATYSNSQVWFDGNLIRPMTADEAAQDQAKFPAYPLSDSTAAAAIARAAAYDTMLSQVAAVGGEISAEQAAVTAAIQGVQAGTVNVAELAQALVPILAPADAAAFQAALATALAK